MPVQGGGQPASTRALEAVFREDRGRLLAILAARFGDLDLTEDVASDAVEAALIHWPMDGVPEQPLAWLLTTARRKALDRVRRDQTYTRRLALLRVDVDRAGTGPGPGPPRSWAPTSRTSGCSCSSPAATRLCRWRLGPR